MCSVLERGERSGQAMRLAKVAGVDESTVAKWEWGLRSPCPGRLNESSGTSGDREWDWRSVGLGCEYRGTFPKFDKNCIV